MTYQESSIVTLSALEHIRLRPGMYIGRLGDGTHEDDGIYVLFKEVIDNAIDEFIMHQGERIVITLDADCMTVSVRDFGRGIPLGKVVECVSEINTGAKYNEEVFQFSVGMNGVGLKAVNALSSSCTITSYREGAFFEGSFAQGKLLLTKTGSTKEPNGTRVVFTPDTTLFPGFQFDTAILEKQLWRYAYLHTGLTLIYNEQTILSTRGLLDLLEKELPPHEMLYPPFHLRSDLWECAFVHGQGTSETYFSFVNGQHTAGGGTHLSAFKEALVKGLNAYSNQQFLGVDVREGIVGALLVRIKNPVFESQTKNKLGNTELRTPLLQELKEAVYKACHQYPEQAQRWIDHAEHHAALRKEILTIKKARDKHKKSPCKIPQLRDCKFHWQDRSLHAEHTMIFITEGESASASLVASRDPLSQAIFSLKGKPLNVYGLKQDQLYKNEEMFHLMQALHIEHDLSSLRYNKIILATDADVDGMHIRNLLLTFFLHYFPALVLEGHVYVLQTPLFKVRDKKQTIYCFTEEEQKNACSLCKHPEITRFKGLGEISPSEFKQFIGPTMRLEQIQISETTIFPTLSFFMGKNTPLRKQFILDHLKLEDGVPNA